MNLGGHRMKFILINSLEVSKECVGQIVFAYLGIQKLYEKGVPRKIRTARFTVSTINENYGNIFSNRGCNCFRIYCIFRI